MAMVRRAAVATQDAASPVLKGDLGDRPLSGPTGKTSGRATTLRPVSSRSTGGGPGSGGPPYLTSTANPPGDARDVPEPQPIVVEGSPVVTALEDAWVTICHHHPRAPRSVHRRRRCGSQFDPD